jgi:CRISPR system Cascade subunit CasA
MIRILLPGLLLCVGCVTYTAQPLDPDDILEQVRTTRQNAAAEDVVSLARAAELMRAHGPRVRDARAALGVATAVADTPTPLPNPSIEAGSLFVGGGDVLASGERTIDAALGWSVLLGGRRRLTDELNAIRAEAAGVEAATVEREEYLALRREIVALALAVRVTGARRDLEKAVRASQDLLRRLVEAGQATALDVRELELEVYGAAAAFLASVEAEEEARADLAARTGVPAGVFRATDAPPLPAEVPSVARLHDAMLRGDPELARLRAEYAVAEKELRLEVARQYPALDVGLGFERDEGANRFGLALGIELPVFDRNQPGIAAADARRTEVRRKFETQVARGLAAVEGARRRLLMRRERLALMRDKIGPAATDALELARRGLRSGVTDALRFLTVLRIERGVRLDVLDAERAVYEAWSDLEEACGGPLLRFPKEPGEQEEQ